MTDSYALDPVKAKVRDEIERFSDSHLPKDRSQSWALYLSAENDLETRLLDRLGFAREHRVILEGDPKKVKAVKKANPGVRVLPMMTHDFFARDPKEFGIPGPFSYVGLDYECMLNRRVLADIAYIASGELIKNEGIIYTNVVGQREQEAIKLDYLDFLLSLSRSDRGLSRFLGRKIFLSEIYERATQEKLARGISFKDEREGITREVLEEIRNRLPKEGLSFIRQTAASLSIEMYLRWRQKGIAFLDPAAPGVFEALCVRADEESIRRGVEGRKKNSKLTYVSVAELIERQKKLGPLGISAYNERLPEGRAHQLTRDYYRANNLPLFPCALENIDAHGYVARTSSHFMYGSNKNTSMLLDIFHVRRINPALRDFINELISEEVIVLRYNKRPFLLDKKALDDVESYLDKVLLVAKSRNRHFSRLMQDRVGDLKRFLDVSLNSELIYKRTDMGSSYRPALRSMDVAREFVLAGASDQEISGKYHVGKNMTRTIAALRAHHTQGTLRRSEKSLERYTEKNIVNPKAEEKARKKEKNIDLELKYLIHRDVHRKLLPASKMRMQYFMDDVVAPLSPKKQEVVREAFSGSNLRNTMDPNIDPYRVYYFFDLVENQIRKGRKVDSMYLNETWQEVRYLPALVETVKYKSQPIKLESLESAVPQSTYPLTPAIKDQIRANITEGFSPEDLWPEYKQYFPSRRHFGAVCAWASPSLAKKARKK